MSLLKPIRLAALALAGALAMTTLPAAAALINFSFINEDGGTAGTVSGTITLADGDGTFAATSVIVDSAPAAAAYAVGFDFTSFSVIENSFTVVGGAVDSGASSFLGLFNGGTALSLRSGPAGGASFLDLLNAGNFGATGVRDADSSTLTYTASSGSIPAPGTLALFALGAVGIGNAARRKRLDKSA